MKTKLGKIIQVLGYFPLSHLAFKESCPSSIPLLEKGSCSFQSPPTCPVQIATISFPRSYPPTHKQEPQTSCSPWTQEAPQPPPLAQAPPSGSVAAFLKSGPFSAWHQVKTKGQEGVNQRNSSRRWSWSCHPSLAAPQLASPWEPEFRKQEVLILRTERDMGPAGSAFLLSLLLGEPLGWVAWEGRGRGFWFNKLSYRIICHFTLGILLMNSVSWGSAEGILYVKQ